MRTLTSNERIFVLTGAGISAESGIRTFRDSRGLWEEHRIEDVASPEGFARDAGLVWRFYAARRKQAMEVEPNEGHRALARLQESSPGSFFLCTQNVDGLHERSGSCDVVHMHGELAKTRCTNRRCQRSEPFADERTFAEGTLPHCPLCGRLERPHIVWFGEMPLEMKRIQAELAKADVLLVVGTSGNVYPAAGFVYEFADRRARGENVRSIYIGPERPMNADAFDEIALGTASEVLPRFTRLG